MHVMIKEGVPLLEKFMHLYSYILLYFLFSDKYGI